MVSRLAFIFTSITAIAALCATILSYCSVDLSYKNSALENRPYISVKFLPPYNVGYDDANDRKIQIAFSLSNGGKTPASNLQFKWYIATDQDNWVQPPNDFWEHRDSGGGNPFPKTLFGGESLPDTFAYNASIGGNSKFIYLIVVATYDGINQDHKYWTMSKLKFESQKGVRTPLLNADYSEWDNNSNALPPYVPKREEAIQKGPEFFFLNEEIQTNKEQ